MDFTIYTPLKSIISEECRPRKSKAVGFGIVEETQFDKLPNENDELIQSASDSTAGPSGLRRQSSPGNRSPPSRSPPLRRRSTQSSSRLPDDTSTALRTERQSPEDTRLADSFTALRNALRDDKEKSP